MSAPLRIDVLTLFPRMFDSPFAESIVARAQRAGRLELEVHDIRTHATDKHHVADDAPYGGGAGMVLRPEPLTRAIRAVRGASGHVVLLSAQGRLFDQAAARRLATVRHLVLVCGHYEGVDERVVESDVAEELSIGDYVLTGGELAAMVVIDAVTRLVPEVIDAESLANESHTEGLLEGPQYTRPPEFEGRKVVGIAYDAVHTPPRGPVVKSSAGKRKSRPSPSPGTKSFSVTVCVTAKVEYTETVNATSSEAAKREALKAAEPRDLDWSSAEVSRAVVRIKSP